MRSIRSQIKLTRFLPRLKPWASALLPLCESTSECISSPLSAQNMGEIAGACGYRHMECGYNQSSPVVLINRSETEVNDRNRFLNRSRSGAANPRPQTPLADLPVSDVQGSSIVLRFTSGDTDSQHNHFTGNPRQSNSN